MNKNYSPQDFFACMPNAFLKQYFDNHHVMQDIDFENKDDDFIKKILPVGQCWMKHSGMIWKRIFKKSTPYPMKKG